MDLVNIACTKMSCLACCRYQLKNAFGLYSQMIESAACTENTSPFNRDTRVHVSPVNNAVSKQQNTFSEVKCIAAYNTDHTRGSSTTTHTQHTHTHTHTHNTHTHTHTHNVIP